MANQTFDMLAYASKILGPVEHQMQLLEVKQVHCLECEGELDPDIEFELHKLHMEEAQKLGILPETSDLFSCEAIMAFRDAVTQEFSF